MTTNDLVERLGEMDEIGGKLDELYQIRCAEDVLRLDLEGKRQAILEPVREQLADLEAEYRGKFDSVTTQKAALEGVIKDAVKKLGETVRGSNLMAVFSKGRASWDGKKLDGFAKAHPEIAEFKTVGDPSVSFRNIE